MKSQYFAALLVVLSSFAPAVAGPSVRTVALNNTQAPGVGDETLFNGLSLPVLNNKGQTAFASTISEGIALDSSVWSEGTGSLALVVREGDTAPGTEPGVTFLNMGIPSLSDTGRTAFLSTLNGVSNPPEGIEGYWSYTDGSLDLLARSNAQAPGTAAGVEFSGSLGSGNPAISDNGTIAIEAIIHGPGVNSLNNKGIWTQSTGSLNLAFRGGTQAPGLGPETYIYGPTGAYFVPVVNDAGEIAFQGTLTGPGIGPTNNQSVWSTGGGSLHLVARSGSQAPNAPAGVNFTSFSMVPSILLNDNGETAFHGYTSDGGEGIWSERGGLHAVARTGHIAPNLPGETFSAFAFPVLNGNSRVAFKAYLASGKQGLWSEGNGNLTLVANVGDQAPGAPAGVTFAGFGSGGTLNRRGQLAFQATLAGLETGGGGGSGVWVHDIDGILRAIVRTGDMIEVAPGDIRTVGLVGFIEGSGNEDGRYSAFNDLGQLAFHVVFTDSTQGIFVTDIVAIPEPAGWVLALFAFGAVRHRHGW